MEACCLNMELGSGTQRAGVGAARVVVHAEDRWVVGGAWRSLVYLLPVLSSPAMRSWTATHKGPGGDGMSDDVCGAGDAESGWDV
jgi:hypothetical protein